MRWRRILLLLAVCGIALGVALEYAARRTASALVRSLEPLASLTFSSAGIALDGSVRLRDPQLVLHLGGWQGQLHARTADVRGGNAFWLVGRLLATDSGFPDQMSVQTKALRFGQGGSESALSGWMGTASLVPFENLGCGSDPLRDKDRIRMGIEPLERIDRFDYRLEPGHGKLHLSMELRSPNVSEIRGFAELSGFDAADWQKFATQSLLRLDRAGVSYEDSGYFARRNQFCAQWLGSSTAEFINRHVIAVDAFLDARGISPSKKLLGLYQNLVTRGGTLGLTSLPETSWAPSEIAAYPRQKLLRQLNVTTRLGDAPPIMFRLAFSDPDKPLSFAADPVPSETIFASTSELADSSVTEESVAGSSVAESVETPVSTELDEPVVTAESASSSSSSIEVPASAATVAEDPVVVDSAAAPDERRVIASAPPPPKDSTLALVWKPGVIERLPAQAAKERDYRVLPISELRTHIGDDVRFLTRNGKRVSGELVQVTADHAVLKIRVGRGEAELDVLLSQIREVRLPLHRE